MYRILLLNGPHKGKSFELKEGENYIGRTEDNHIVFPSSSVSKKHCCITVAHGKIEIQDLNSSNGVFINGIKIDHEYILKGSKISIGNYIFEVRENASRLPTLGGSSNALVDPIKNNSIQLQTAPLGQEAPPASSNGMEIAAWHVEKKVMPLFYQMNQKYEWRSIALGMFVLFILSSVALSVFPLLRQNEKSIIEEAQKRAQLLAIQIVEDNAGHIAKDEETNTRITPLAKSKLVKLAVLTDLSGRIIAPPENFNQVVVSPKEAKLLSRAAEVYKKNPNELGFSTYLGDEIVAAIEPVKLLDPSIGRNITVGLALVSLDVSNELFSTTDVGVNFFSTLIIVFLIASLVIYPFYRLTVKRFEDMNSEVDRILKGEQTELSTQYKFNELSSFIEVLNSAFQRLTTISHADSVLGGGAVAPVNILDILPLIRSLNEGTQSGVIVCNKNFEIQYINEIAEEMTGISYFGNENKVIFQSARDEAFSSFLKDIFQQLDSLQAVIDQFEFSGITYKVDGNKIGHGIGAGYVLVLTKQSMGEMDQAI